MATCWYCNSEVPETSQYCPSCGHSQTDHSSSPLFGVVDPTTGIWNSKFVNALVGQEANRAVRYHRPLSVLVIELDHAEHIHKELEQIQVEGLLRDMAERLGQSVRDESGAALAADKIRRSIASHDFGTAGAWKRITVSCGAATIDSDYRPRDEAGMVNRREYTGNLLREAYLALDSGRSSGTNRTTVGAYRS